MQFNSPKFQNFLPRENKSSSPSKFINPNTRTVVPTNWGRILATNSTYVAVSTADRFVTSFTSTGPIYIYRSSDMQLVKVITAPFSQGQLGPIVLTEKWLITSNTFYRNTLGTTPSNNGTSGDAVGRVYIYSTSTWELVSEIASPYELPNNLVNTIQYLDWGTTLAATDRYLLVGAPGVPRSGQNFSGEIHLYDLNTLTKVISLPNPNFSGNFTSDQFGSGLAINDQYFAAGAIGESTNLGVVHVYTLDPQSLLGTIVNPNNFSQTTADQFGQILKLDSSNNLFVGTPRESTATLVNAGVVYQFSLPSLSLVRTYVNPSSRIYFGRSVDSNGQQLAIGAGGIVHIYDIASGTLLNQNENLVTPLYGENIAIDSTFVYFTDRDVNELYKRRIDNTPNTVTTVSATTVQDKGNFLGFSNRSKNLCSNSKYIFCGASTAGTDNAGKVYVIDINTNELAYVLDNPNVETSSVFDGFGQAVDASENVVIVGASGEDVGGISSGTVYIFDANTGVPITSFNNTSLAGASANDLFGITVATTDFYCVVGAYGDQTNGLSLSGSVHIYRLDNKTLVRSIPNPNAGQDIFGGFVEINSKYVYVAAESYNSNTGRVYVYDLGLNATALTIIENPDNTYRRFGTIMAASDQYLAVGTSGTFGTGVLNFSPGRISIYTVSNHTLFRTIENPDWPDTILFGSKMSISGNFIAISADFYRDPANSIINEGIVYLYEISSGNLIKKFRNPNGGLGKIDDGFGFGGVSISNNKLIVGSIYEENTEVYSNNSGAIYTYDLLKYLGPNIMWDMKTFTNPSLDLDKIDDFGIDVAIHGNHIIVGAPRDDVESYVDADNFVTTNQSGSAYIFNFQTGELIYHLTNPNNFGTSDFDLFGKKVALTDNYAIVGTDQEDELGQNQSGIVYVFSMVDGTRVHTITNPNASGTAGNDLFGSSLAACGNYLIVGARQEDDASINSGKAYIFNLTTGNRLHTLNNPNEGSFTGADNFGYSVDISEYYSIVGAPFNDTSGSGNTSGSAYIYRNSDGAILHTLTNANRYDTVTGDRFGVTVAISNSYAAVSAESEDDEFGSNAGAVYVYNVLTGNLVAEIPNLNLFGNTLGENFGLFNLSIVDTLLVIGSRTESRNNIQDGVIYVYDFLKKEIIHLIESPERSILARFGTVAAISDRYIVSAISDTAAYVFNLDVLPRYKSPDFSRDRILNNPNASGTPTDDRFGESISASNNFFIVGAYFEDDLSPNSGKAYLYDNVSGTVRHVLSNPNIFGSSGNDSFGYSVAISDSKAIIGAPFEDTATTSDTGAAFIYDCLTGSLLNTLTSPNAGSLQFGVSVSISDSYALVGAHTEGSGGEGKNWVGSFTTSGTYLEVADRNELDLEQTTYCIECWINHDFPAAGGLGGLVTKRPTGDSSFWFSITGSSNQDMRIYYAAWRSGGADSGAGATPIIAGTWYHVAVTRTGGSTAGVIRLFVNGKLDAVINETSPAFTNTNSLKIGRTDASATSRFYRGLMSNLRITRDGLPAGYSTTSTTVGDQIFTAPARSFSFNNEPGVVLLTLQSSTHVDVTGKGTVVQQGSVPLTQNTDLQTLFTDEAAQTAVYVYNLSDGSLKYSLFNPDLPVSQNDFFGFHVGNTDKFAIVGAYNEDIVADDNGGKAYIYDLDTGNLLHTLSNPSIFGLANNDRFGYRVAIDGPFAAVSAYREDSVFSVDTGAVYVYNCITGQLLYSLTNPNPSLSSYGFALSIKNGYLLVGNPTSAADGSAHIYDITTGNLLATLDNPNIVSGTGDSFGVALDISGNYALIGASGEGELNATISGKVYRFKLPDRSKEIYSFFHNSSVEEESSLDIEVLAINVANNITLYWSVSSPDNFSTTTGDFSLINGYGTFSLDTQLVGSNENKVFYIILRKDNAQGEIVAVSTAITIIAKIVTFDITPESNNIDEGSSLNFSVTTTNVSNRTLYWTVSNSTDFTLASGNFPLSNGSGNFSVSPTEDFLTEGVETFSVSLRLRSITGPVVIVSESITINDTSLNVTVEITPAADNVDEGTSLIINVATENVPSFSTLYWTVETNAGDFAVSSGSFDITDNAGSFSVTPAFDFNTEGAESFVVSIRVESITGRVIATSDPIVINDTSLTPTVIITPVADNIDEDSALQIDVATTNIPTGTTLYWTVETNAGDFAVSSGSFDITDNAGSFSVTPTADNETEGTETFTVSIRLDSINGDILATSDAISINDTSLSAVAGQTVFTIPGSTTNWTAPEGVTSVCVVCVGGGGGGGGGNQWGAGGAGGNLRYKNNIPVVPGQSYQVRVGIGGAQGPNNAGGGTAGGVSSFDSTTVVAQGGGAGGTAPGQPVTTGNVGDGGGNGGAGGDNSNLDGGGGGAGGYSGDGGQGSNGVTFAATAGQGGGGSGGAGGAGGAGGGGVGLLGEGASGAAPITTATSGSSVYQGNGGSGGDGGRIGRTGTTTSGGGDYQAGAIYGAGGGGGYGGGPGAGGAVRIIWGGNRAFPNTNTADV